MGNFPDTLGMLDRYSGGRLVSGLVQGGAVETWQAGIDPTENRDRFEEARALIMKCWSFITYSAGWLSIIMRKSPSLRDKRRWRIGMGWSWNWPVSSRVG